MNCRPTVPEPEVIFSERSENCRGTVSIKRYAFVFFKRNINSILKNTLAVMIKTK